MPVSARRSESTDGDEPVELRKPQARVIRALVPDDPSSYWTEWPIYNRAWLAIKAGFTPISGTVTRALNGIRPGSSSGPPHLGLLALGYVEEESLEVDGVQETYYRATPAGVRAYQAYVAGHGPLPPVKDAASATNTNRGYNRGQWRQGADRHRGRIDDGAKEET